jgi:hypothetical protein
MCQGCALASQDFACDLQPQAKSWQNIKLFIFSPVLALHVQIKMLFVEFQIDFKKKFRLPIEKY